MTFLTASEWITNVGPEKYLELNQKLAKKKSEVRKQLSKIKVAKDKTNGFDKYTYLSESGYKSLVNGLYTDAGLELTASEIDCDRYETSNSKQPNGAKVKWAFVTTDTETGFSEVSIVSGEGIDKGDKAVYKAHTGAMKYFAANNLLVATGDDAESESPEAVVRRKEREEELSNMLVQVARIKTEADGLGIDVRGDDNIKAWVMNATKMKGSEPSTVAEAKKYIAAVQKLIDRKKQQTDEVSA